jgi:hypothetical protein
MTEYLKKAGEKVMMKQMMTKYLKKAEEKVIT